MRYLFSKRSRVLSQIRRAKRVYLLLDFDGTLARIVSRPDKAVLSGKTKSFLNGLARKKKFRLGVISGRKLADVKKRVGLSGITYAGNHGLELYGPGVKFIHPMARQTKPLLKKIARSLKDELKKTRGAIVEDKGLTVDLHYRLVAKSDLPRVRAVFRKVTGGFEDKIRLTRGKKFLEAKPRLDWNKGRAVKRLVSSWGKDRLLVYLGDDLTDEDVFRMMKKRGISIYVGKNKSSRAKYFLKDTGEVEEFLRRLDETR